MDKRLALLAIRLLVSVNFSMLRSFSSLPGCQVRCPVHADVVKRSTDWYLSRYFGSGQESRTVIAVLLLIPRQPDLDAN